MTDEAICVELRNINRRLEKVESFIDNYDHKQTEFYEQHCKLCGAFRFFDDPKLRDKLFNTIYEVANQKEVLKNRGVWIRWIIALPIVGLYIERIINIWNHTSKGN